MMAVLLIIIFIFIIQPFSVFYAAENKNNLKIIYANKGIINDIELPLCEPQQVCNIVSPPPVNRLMKYCRCHGSTGCSEDINIFDNHTIEDKNNDNQIKICENIINIPECNEYEATGEDRLWYHHLSLFIYCKCPPNCTHELTNHTLDTSGHHFIYSCVPRKICSENDACCLIWLIQTSPNRWSYDGVYKQCLCPNTTECSKDYYSASVFESQPKGKLAYVYCK